MKFKMDGFLGKLVRTVATPRVAAALGVCAAAVHLYMALDDLRKTSKDRQK